MIIYGKQVFFYVFKKHRDKILEIYLAKKCDKHIFNEIKKSNIKIRILDNMQAQAMARGGNHQGFLAKITPLQLSEISFLKTMSFITILHNLTDVGNIGAIARSAYALGCEGIVVISKNLNLEPLIRTSSGAAMDIPIAICNDIFGLINELKHLNFQIIAANKNGIELKNSIFEHKKALIFGSEGEGLNSKILSKCDNQVGIKLRNNFDSLNVSAAFAIICNKVTNG